MYLNAHNIVQINGSVLNSVMGISYKNDCNQIGANCDIMVPLKSRIQNNGQYLTDDVRNLFVKGQPVKVNAWYDEYSQNVGILNVFNGFVYDFVEGTPMKIRCLDYNYFFRLGTIKKLYYTKERFIKVIRDIIAEANKNVDIANKSGYKIPRIELMTPYLDFEVINLSFTNLSPGACLEWLKKQLCLVITMVGNKLYVNLSSNTIGEVNLYTDQNVIEPLQLQKPDAAFQKFHIKAQYPKPDGTKQILETGDEDGIIHEIKLFFVTQTDKGENIHQKLLDNALNEKRLGHYTGELNTLLYPNYDLFWKINFTDVRYTERSAKYIVREKELTISESGYHNKCKIAYLGEL
jgi:hypothetical protein